MRHQQTKNQKERQKAQRRELDKKKITVLAALSALTFTMLGISTCSILQNKNKKDEAASTPVSNRNVSQENSPSNRIQPSNSTQIQPLDRILTLEDAKKFQRVYTEPLTKFGVYRNPSKRCQETLSLLKAINNKFVSSTSDGPTITESLRKLFELYSLEASDKIDSESLSELAKRIRDELAQNGILVNFSLARSEGVDHPFFLAIAAFKAQSIEQRAIKFEGKVYQIPIIRAETIDSLDPLGVAKKSWAVTINGAVVIDPKNVEETYHLLEKTLDEARKSYSNWLQELGLDPSRKDQFAINLPSEGAVMTREEWYLQILGVISTNIKSLSIEEVTKLVINHEIGHAIQHIDPNRIERFLEHVKTAREYSEKRTIVAEVDARYLEGILSSGGEARTTELRLILDIAPALKAPSGYDNQHSKIANIYVTNLGISSPVIGKVAAYGLNAPYAMVYLNLCSLYYLKDKEAQQELGDGWIKWQQKNLPDILNRIAQP